MSQSQTPCGFTADYVNNALDVLHDPQTSRDPNALAQAQIHATLAVAVAIEHATQAIHDLRLDT